MMAIVEAVRQENVAVPHCVMQHFPNEGETFSGDELCLLQLQHRGSHLP